jgi:hypothetical protein
MATDATEVDVVMAAVAPVVVYVPATAFVDWLPETAPADVLT